MPPPACVRSLFFASRAGFTQLKIALRQAVPILGLSDDFIAGAGIAAREMPVAIERGFAMRSTAKRAGKLAAPDGRAPGAFVAIRI